MQFHFSPATLPPEAEALRTEVRDFLAEAMTGVSADKKTATWDGFDPDFSRAVGARGWIGMTWPNEHGGHEKTALERYVMLEEMLAAGAPVSAHWFADRQSGPLLLRYGNEEQQALLPRIARGEICFAVGISEPDVGSDASSVRTRAKLDNQGWVLNGSKIWTTNAHRCHYMTALVRTSGKHGDRHEGLSQVLIDINSLGITVRPIRDIAGREHFNEVIFEDVRLPASAVIGKEGAGWSQVMNELAFERSGPERYLSSLQSLIQLIDHDEANSERSRVAIGKAVAQVATLRQMSMSIAVQLQTGHAPNLEAALVKDLGTTFEQSLPNIIHDIIGLEPSDEGTEAEKVQARLLQLTPCFSLRGGTREILRGIIARGLDLR